MIICGTCGVNQEPIINFCITSRYKDTTIDGMGELGKDKNTDTNTNKELLKLNLSLLCNPPTSSILPLPLSYSDVTKHQPSHQRSNATK